MSEELLTDLSIKSRENNIMDTLDIKEVIKKFLAAKAKTKNM